VSPAGPEPTTATAYWPSVESFGADNLFQLAVRVQRFVIGDVSLKLPIAIGWPVLGKEAELLALFLPGDKRARRLPAGCWSS